jgi:hypothetical protein
MAQKEAPKPRETIRHRSNSYAEVYSNSVELKMSVFDFELVFGKILTGDEKKLVIEERVSVSMSPQHAKVFLKVLSDNVKNYEMRFGPIGTQMANPGDPDDSKR